VTISYKNFQQEKKSPFDRKNILEACPIFHYLQERIKRHVFCNFPALYPETAFHESLEAKKELPWGEVAGDFKVLNLWAIKLYLNGPTYLLPTVLRGLIQKLFVASTSKYTDLSKSVKRRASSLIFRIYRKWAMV